MHCRECGAEQPAGWRFCGSCGARAAAAAAPEGPPAPAGASRVRVRRSLAALLVAFAAVSTSLLVSVLGGAPSTADRPAGHVVVTPPAPDAAVPSPVRPEPQGPPIVERSPLHLPSPVAVRVLAVSFHDSRLAVLDLATGEPGRAGEVTVYPRGTHGLTTSALTGAILTPDGVLVESSPSGVRVYAEGVGQASLVYQPAEVPSPPGEAIEWMVVPTLDGQRLWVVYPGHCCLEQQRGQAELVDLTTGAVLATASLPAFAAPVAAIPSGLLLRSLDFVDTGDGWTEAAGSQRVLEVGLDGQVADLGPGEVIGASGGSAAVFACPTHAQRSDCELELLDTATGDRRPVSRPVEGGWYPVTGPPLPTSLPLGVASSPYPILVGIGVRDPDDPQQGFVRSYLAAVDPSHPEEVAIVAEHDGRLSLASWSRDGKHVVVAGIPADGDLTVIDLDGGSSFVVTQAFLPGYYPVAAR